MLRLDPRPEGVQPSELERVVARPNRPTVHDVQVHDPDAVDRGCHHAGLVGDTNEALRHVLHRSSGQQRNPFRPAWPWTATRSRAPGNRVRGRARPRLSFLEGQHVWTVPEKESLRSGESRLHGVHVPCDELHGHQPKGRHRQLWPCGRPRTLAELRDVGLDSQAVRLATDVRDGSVAAVAQWIARASIRVMDFPMDVSQRLVPLGTFANTRAGRRAVPRNRGGERWPSGETFNRICEMYGWPQTFVGAAGLTGKDRGR